MTTRRAKTSRVRYRLAITPIENIDSDLLQTSWYLCKTYTRNYHLVIGRGLHNSLCYATPANEPVNTDCVNYSSANFARLTISDSYRWSDDTPQFIHRANLNGTYQNCFLITPLFRAAALARVERTRDDGNATCLRVSFFTDESCVVVLLQSGLNVQKLMRSPANHADRGNMKHSGISWNTDQTSSKSSSSESFK